MFYAILLIAVLVGAALFVIAKIGLWTAITLFTLGAVVAHLGRAY
jgi:hypothetical protein